MAPQKDTSKRSLQDEIDHDIKSLKRLTRLAVILSFALVILACLKLAYLLTGGAS